MVVGGAAARPVERRKGVLSDEGLLGWDEPYGGGANRRLAPLQDYDNAHAQRPEDHGGWLADARITSCLTLSVS
jgi:hypothetical protein